MRVSPVIFFVIPVGVITLPDLPDLPVQALPVLPAAEYWHWHFVPFLLPYLYHGLQTLLLWYSPQYYPGCSRYVPVDSVQHQEQNVAWISVAVHLPLHLSHPLHYFLFHLQYQYCNLPVYQCRYLLPSRYQLLQISYFCGHSAHLHGD